MYCLIFNLLDRDRQLRAQLFKYKVFFESLKAVIPRYYFLDIIINHQMTIARKLLLLSLLLVLSVQQYSDNRQAFSSKKGLTFQATIWPVQANNFLGRMSCNNCDPNNGDTSCTVKLPLTCIINYQSLDRPFYSFYPTFTPYNNPDQSYYEGWTGGVIALTDPVLGLQVDSYVTGTKICQNAFGANTRFATFADGFYMPYQNGPTIALEKTWNWAKTLRGQYNFWGVFNHNHIGRSWVWTQTTPNGNCVVPKTRTISP